VWTIILAFGALDAGAQTTPDLGAMAAKMKRNQEQLQNYTWQANYTYTVNGVLKRTDVYRIRTKDGFQERMQLKSERDKAPVRRANGKKLSKKERQAAYEWVMEAKKQLDAYLNPMFAEKAVSTAAATTEGENLILTATDVIKPGDSVVIRYARSTLDARSASVRTMVGDSPVALEIEFASLEYGPNYTARSVTTGRWQEFDLVISTVNSNINKDAY
jgi:hypothetical protein